MRFLLLLLVITSTSGCQAQIQKWQRERTVEHLSRIESYHGHLNWTIAGESASGEVWFKTPDQFLLVAKDGAVTRSDGQTMEIFDPKTRLHLVFKHLPSVSNEQQKKLIADLFDQSMNSFVFSLGPIGKVAGRDVIELRSKTRGESVVDHGTSQILDEFSFPLASDIVFVNKQDAKYEFTDIAMNEKFELPKAKIPKGAFEAEWDFNSTSAKPATLADHYRNLKLEKFLKRETGETLAYYRNGAQYVSELRYKNWGVSPQTKGISVKIGRQSGILVPGPISNVLTVTTGDTSVFYSSNMLIDDLIAFAAR